MAAEKNKEIKLPSFLVVGAAKAGTTSLHHYLAEHPGIYMPQCKETHFLSDPVELFNKNSRGGLYGKGRVENLTDYKKLYEDCDPEAVLGEVCVSYLYFYRETIPKIKQILGDPKIIIILRDPVERAFSNYMHTVRDGFETKGFLQAVDFAKDRLQRHWWWGYDYIGGSMYADAVEAYQKEFNNVKVVFFEQLKSNPLGLMHDLYSFIGIDPEFEPNISKIYNRAGVPRFPAIARARKNSTFLWKILTRSRKIFGDVLIDHLVSYKNEKISLNQVNRKKTASFFTEDIGRLEGLLGVNLDDWRTV